MGWFDQEMEMVGRLSHHWARWVLWSMGISYEIKGMNHLSREINIIL
tara:strand:- start:119 stop:259 length:141 start_codon:yes stop_codon:yes gene_type:complete